MLVDWSILNAIKKNIYFKKRKSKDVVCSQ